MWKLCQWLLPYRCWWSWCYMDRLCLRRQDSSLGSLQKLDMNASSTFAGQVFFKIMIFRGNQALPAGSSASGWGSNSWSSSSPSALYYRRYRSPRGRSSSGWSWCRSMLWRWSLLWTCDADHWWKSPFMKPNFQGEGVVDSNHTFHLPSMLPGKPRSFTFLSLFDL